MSDFLVRCSAVATVLGSVLATAAIANERESGLLFNGRDLSGWTFVSRDAQAHAKDVWSVKKGVLICRGTPVGYLRTKADYENYRLQIHWRWKPGGKGGNGGVLVHTSTPKELAIWPKSVEIQLQSKNAGEFWTIGTELHVENEATRRKDRQFLKLAEGSEKAVGKWNKMEIDCRGDQIRVWVNGVLVNHATDCSETKGAICLQSEGTEMHFRKITLTPLED